MSKVYHEDISIYLSFTAALPKAYDTVVDTLAFQASLPVSERIRAINIKDADMLTKKNKEKGHGAQEQGYRASDKYVPPHRKNSNDSDVSMADSVRGLKCYLCDQNHGILVCPYYEAARREVRKIRRDERRARDARSKSKGARMGKRDNARKPQGRHYQGKNHRANAGVTSSTDDASSSGDFDNEEEEKAETAGISMEQIRTFKSHPVYKSSLWPADSGCTRHMSDQLDLFRSLKRCARRTIQVGGGEMYSEYTGEVVAICEDGSRGLLRDVLYVPGLGINLLSVRKICDAGLKGRLDSTRMYFKKDGKKVIEAILQNGLYIVTHFDDNYKEIALPARAGRPQLPAYTNKHEKEVMETYLLIHRRFNHLGPQKLRNLYKVTTLILPIEIPKKILLCHVYAISKIKNSIPKELLQRAERLLALVQFDIAGPFPLSVNGNQYFLLIIDNWSNKEWFVPIRSKSDAQSELAKWKVARELETGQKVLSARSDNAPELIKGVRD